MPRRPLALCLLLALVACGDEATQTVAEGQGASPKLPPPRQGLIPTINIAPARGWAEGAMPKPGDGLRVAAFAEGLDHPRWLIVLPNGDVLVAETNGAEAAGGRQGYPRLGAGRCPGLGRRKPSANRITLLRDADHDGKAETRAVLAAGAELAFRHGPGG